MVNAIEVLNALQQISDNIEIQEIKNNPEKF